MTDTPNVYAALSAVMADVQTVRKDSRNNDQGYVFRGIDAVVNAVGPVLRKHRVLMLPELLDASYRDVRTSRDKPAREVTVRVKYTFIGPAGDSIEVTVPGEAMDSGDKGTAKAMSVACRIALLQALCIPTDEPDPDEASYERSYSAPRPDPLAAAKQAVVDAWEKHRGLFNADQASGHYASWANGAVLSEASIDELHRYAEFLADEKNKEAADEPS